MHPVEVAPDHEKVLFHLHPRHPPPFEVKRDHEKVLFHLDPMWGR